MRRNNIDPHGGVLFYRAYRGVTEWRGSGLQSRAHGFDSRHRVEGSGMEDVAPASVVRRMLSGVRNAQSWH